MRKLLCGFCAIGLFAPLLAGQARESAEQRVKRFLLERYQNAVDTGDDLLYFAAFVDLNGDHKVEVVIYVIGSSVCGSSGCNTLILTPAKAGYRVVSEVELSQLPIRILPESSHGWRSLSQIIGGGGVPPEEVALVYDGHEYVGRSLRKGENGKILIPTPRDAPEGWKHLRE